MASEDSEAEVVSPLQQPVLEQGEDKEMKAKRKSVRLWVSLCNEHLYLALDDTGNHNRLAVKKDDYCDVEGCSVVSNCHAVVMVK